MSLRCKLRNGSGSCILNALLLKKQVPATPPWKSCASPSPLIVLLEEPAPVPAPVTSLESEELIVLGFGDSHLQVLCGSHFIVMNSKRNQKQTTTKHLYFTGKAFFSRVLQLAWKGHISPVRSYRLPELRNLLR